MLRARYGAAIVLFVLSASPAFSKKAPTISESELAQITERGRALYQYDQVAWHATDAVLATHPSKGEDGRYIAQRTDKGWVVAFGHLNQTHDAFLIAHVATRGTADQEFSVEHLATPKQDTGFFLAAAKAIDLSLQDFQGENRPYNTAVLPAPAGQLYVYVLPAITKDGVYLVGGDERYTVSADGNTLVEKHRMHHSIITMDMNNVPQGSKVEAGYHVHVLSGVPEDSDVLYVLTRKPTMPEFIGVDGKMRYQIKEDGTILPQK